MAYFQFLGTGPSTPITDASGRNYRRRSSALMQHIATYALIDVTHDFEEQVDRALTVTAAMVTNGSRDAAGGLTTLDRWAEHRVDLYATDELWEELNVRYGPFEKIDHQRVTAGRAKEVGDLHLTAFALPNGASENGRANFGYHFDTGKRKVTYASDFKDIPPESEKYFTGNDLLIVDAAGWDKDLPTHRGAINRLPEYIAGNNERIVFTHLGRSAPPHSLAENTVQQLTSAASVAYDFMKVPLGR
jgi:phosphoribosyl 1,2-cyclic phosphodiesterase